MKQVRIAGLYVAVIIIQILLVRMYQLKPVFIVPLAVAGVVSLAHIKETIMEGKKYEQDYQDAVLYMEQILCSYRRLEHAGKALRDCSTIFRRESRMNQAIDRAIHILMTGEGVEDGRIYEAAFLKIDEEYHSRRMRIIHTFLCNGEQMGGEISRSVDILLEDLQLWKNRTRLYQDRKHFIQIECGIATALSLILCYVSRLLTPDELMARVCGSMVYQVSTAIVFLVLWYVIVSICRRLSGDWLDVRDTEDADQRKRQERLYGILCGEVKKTSFLSFHVAKKVVAKYVKQEFPYWLLLVTLYLQSESTYQALKYSMKETRGIFSREIQRLTEEIYDSPRDLEPYLRFFEPLGLTEIQTGMKILYSVSTNGYEDSKRQMDFLVAQNNRLMDQSERFVQDRKMAGMSLLKQLPMLVSCVKLLVDLVSLLAMTMQSFQNIQI